MEMYYYRILIMTSLSVKCGLVILLSLTSSTQRLSSTGRNRYTEAYYNYIVAKFVRGETGQKRKKN